MAANNVLDFGGKKRGWWDGSVICERSYTMILIREELPLSIMRYNFHAVVDQHPDLPPDSFERLDKEDT